MKNLAHISVRTLIVLIICVSVLSSLFTTYAVVSLGLLVYPQIHPSATGTVTINVLPPAEIKTGSGKVLIEVIPAENNSALAANSS